MKRAVRNLFRWLAAGLIVIGVMTAGVELARRRVGHAEIHLWPCLIGAILIAAGAVLFWASPRLAERFTDDFE